MFCKNGSPSGTLYILRGVFALSGFLDDVMDLFERKVIRAVSPMATFPIRDSESYAHNAGWETHGEDTH